MERVLATEDSRLWSFPKIMPVDHSIVKYDHVKILEDSHGTGDLTNATEFSYTTNNDDIWYVPSKSYLKVNN